jgi:peptidoglycan/LPS O-acetylase OafA/YrhL
VLVGHSPFSSTLTPSRHGEGRPAASFPSWVVELVGHGYGLHLFLVLSGFCIHMTWARSDGQLDFIEFWKRRLHRLYPPYFAALALTVLSLYVFFSVLGHSVDGRLAARFGYTSGSQLAIDLVLLIFLMQNLNGASTRIGNGPFWSLALEEQLYLLYFPLLRLRRGGWTRTLVVTGAVTLGWRLLGAYVFVDNNAWFVLGPSRWFEWVLGALAVESYVGRVCLPGWCSSIGVGLACLAVAALLREPMFSHMSPIRAILDPLMGLAFFVLVNAACRLRWGERPGAGLVVRALCAVGLFSYSLYLTHEVVIVAVKQVGLRLGLNIWSIMICRITIAVALAYPFYLMFERPFINRSRAAARARAISKPVRAVSTS